MVDQEKRDDLLDEEDEDDIVEEIEDAPSSDEISSDNVADTSSYDSGPTAEDAVSEADTITGSTSDESSDTVSDPVVEEDEDKHDHNHEHDHHAVVNQNKPWEARNVEIKSESSSDDGMGTGAHTGSDEHISIDKDTFWKYLKIIVVIAVLVLGYNYFSGMGGSGMVDEPAGNVPGEVARVEVSVDDDAIKGDENAPVTIVEFSDYECPFCARFYSQTLNQIDEQYIKTGKVKLVYRDYPLGNHPNAPKAGEAAECAGEQGKYFEMHDKLFDNGVSGGVASYKQFAGEIGLDQAAFDTCLDSGAQAAEVQKDFVDGTSYGVQGTPAFFVNGKLISGAQPFNVFQQAIEAELAA
jgi:protein-disulfide isomerase